MTRRSLLAPLLVLAACAGPAPAPAPEPPPPPGAGRLAESRLHLDARPPEGRLFLVPGRGGDLARVVVIPVAHQRFALQARCDGPARLAERPDPPGASGFQAPAWAPAGVSLVADLAAGRRGALALELAPEATGCALTVRPARGDAYELELRREALARPRIAALDRGAPRCGARRAPADPLEAAFWAQRPLSLSCPMPPGGIRLLPDGIEGFDAKVEALTGRRLGAAALGSGDPDLALDFSDAPELDLIVVSYLNFHADFTGALLARMLAWHAARGTVVRILVSDNMQGAPERALLERLAARHPTVQLQPFRYNAQAREPGEAHLGRIHRTQHTKLFATIAREPGRSRAMIGGRNLHDGYVFPRPFDLSAWPGLRQYRPGRMVFAGGFHSYSDLEAEFLGEAQVRLVVAHWAELWHRDHRTDRLAAPPPPQTAPEAAPAEGPLMRHYISVPWQDGQAQARLYADLIGAARERIDIVSPYLNPPEPVARALDAALARGVRVRVVTTERVNEPGDIFITGLNRQFADRYGDRLTYLDHDPAPRLLHTKAMVIDGRLVVLGSTNLNMRSFVHDLENGVLVLDPALARRVTALIEGYAAQAHPIAAGGQVAGLARLLLRWPLARRVF